MTKWCKIIAMILPILRIYAVPVMAVHSIESLESPTENSDIAVPTLASALANALFTTTGQRLCKLPLCLS
ncbi:MAG: hypothetical protein V3T17_18270 [Pseudomonadales bacterium]